MMEHFRLYPYRDLILEAALCAHSSSTLRTRFKRHAVILGEKID